METVDEGKRHLSALGNVLAEASSSVIANHVPGLPAEAESPLVGVR